MARNRVAFIINVDLDEVPGAMHTQESAQNAIRAILYRNIGHYNPAVMGVRQENSFEDTVSAYTQDDINIADLVMKIRRLNSGTLQKLCVYHHILQDCSGDVLFVTNPFDETGRTRVDTTVFMCEMHRKYNRRHAEEHLFQWPVPVGMADLDVVIDKRYGAMIQARPAAVHGWLIAHLFNQDRDISPVTAVDYYEVVLGGTGETVSAHDYMHKDRSSLFGKSPSEGICGKVLTPGGQTCILRKGHDTNTLFPTLCSSGIEVKP